MKEGSKKVAKPTRTKLGAFFQKYNIDVSWAAREAGLSRNTLNRMVNEKNHSPTVRSVKKVMKVVHKFDKGKKSYHFFDI